MEFIRAAHNLTIELSPTTWRLFNGSYPSDPPDSVIALLEARQGHLTCSPVFAKARRLSGDGQLEPSDVARVVVGWAPESRNWHLGLLLNGDPDAGVKMRWCGLASWPSGAASDSVTQAKLAGQSLARIIDRPFRLVPPKGISGTLQRTQPIQPTDRYEPSAAARAIMLRAQQTPPFTFDGWQMVAVPKGYAWLRPGRSMVGAVVKLIGYVILAAVFIFLGITTQTNGMAAVNPGWLPWVGIVVGAVLILLAVKQIRILLRPGDVLIDTTAREIRCRGGLLGRVNWRMPFDAVQYVLVSQTPAHSEGRASAQTTAATPEGEAAELPMRTSQDVWLHLYDGQRFRQIVALEQVEGFCHDWEAARAAQETPGRRALDETLYDTPVHHAARLMAKAIGADLWLDLV